MIPSEIKTWNSATRLLAETWSANSLRGRFARGAVWSFIAAVISQGANLGASVITARFLGRLQYGEFGIIQSTVGMVGVFAGMGLGLTATKYVAELRVTNPRRAGNIIALSMVVSFGTASLAVVALFAAAPWLTANTLNAPHLSTELRISSGVLFLLAVNGTQVGVLAGLEAFRTIARVSLIRGLLTFPLAVGGVALWNLRGAVAALVAAAAVGWILNHIAIRRECRRNDITVQWDSFWSDRVILWNFSLPAFLSTAMTSPAMWLASSLLVNQPNGYSEMGVFNAANQWRTAVAFLPSLFSQPLLSMLSNTGVANLRSFTKLLHANLLLSFGLSSLIAIPVVVCSSSIMTAYGPLFLVGRPVLVLLVFATVISSTTAVVGQVIASLDKMWWGFILNFAWALVLLAGAVVLVPRYGATGLAGAFLASYLVHAATSTYVQLHLSNRLALLRSTVPSSASVQFPESLP